MPSLLEISINCDRHHGMIRLGRSLFSSMDGDGLSSKHLCPSCGKRMGLTRSIAATSGYSTLHSVWLQRMRGMGHGRIVPRAQLEAVASPFDRYGLEPIRPRAFGLGQHQMIEINLIPIFGQRQAVGSRRCRDRSVGPCLA